MTQCRGSCRCQTPSSHAMKWRHKKGKKDIPIYCPHHILSYTLPEFIKEGLTVQCSSALKRGSFLGFYPGHIVTSNQLIDEIKDESKRHWYTIQLTSSSYLHADSPTTLLRELNQNCSPNCVYEIWNIENKPAVALFAVSNIPAWTCLTMDYHWGTIGPLTFR